MKTTTGPSKKNYKGERKYYFDWRANVVRLADKIELGEEYREQITEPMMRAAWEQNEYPGSFLGKMIRRLFN